MKWSGWGDEATAFTHADKPGLRPFIYRHLQADIATRDRGARRFRLTYPCHRRA